MEENIELVKTEENKNIEEAEKLNLNNRRNDNNLLSNSDNLNTIQGKRSVILLMNTKSVDEEDIYQKIESDSVRQEEKKIADENIIDQEFKEDNKLKLENNSLNQNNLFKDDNKEKIKEIVFLVDEEDKDDNLADGNLINEIVNKNIEKQQSNNLESNFGEKETLLILKNKTVDHHSKEREIQESDKIEVIDEKTNFKKLGSREIVKEADIVIKELDKLNKKKLTTLTIKEEKVEMKDKKIILNIEEIEKQHLHFYSPIEGNFDSHNLEEMKNVEEELDKLHPRLIKDGKYVKYPLCARTGWFCCGGDCGKSELDNLGLGILCYFKVLKVFIICFLIICMLNIPLYYIYANNHKEKGVTNYRDALFKTTIGNIASSVYNCVKFPIDTILTGATQSTYKEFNFDCFDSNITSVVAFGLTSDFPEDSNNLISCTPFSTLNNIKLDSTCNFKDYMNDLISDDCIGKINCKVNVDLKYLEDNCKYTEKFNYFYFSYECHDDYIYVGYDNIRISRGVMGFIVVGIDVASMLVLIICLFINSHSQKKNEELFKQNHILISDYTLHLRGIDFSSANLFKHLDSLIKHFRDVMKEEDRRNSDDYVKRIFSHSEITDENDKFYDFKDKINLEMINKGFIFDINYPILTSDKLDNILSYNQYNFDKKRIEAEIKISENRDEIEFKKNELKLKNLEEKITKIQEDIKKEDKLNTVNELFLTFRNQKIAHFYYENYKKNKCVRCCYIFCCNKNKIKHLYFENEWLDLQFTKDEPSNINWQNFSYNKCKGFLRSFLSILLAVIVMGVSFAVVIGSKYSQDQLLKEFNTNIDCNYVNYTEALVRDEFRFNKSSVERINTYCFCFDLLLEEGYSTTETYILPIDKTITPCNEWVDLFIQFNSLNALIVIIIPVINSLLFLVMKWLTLFEKNKTLTEQMSSSMWKMFILQFINTGLVIVLVNIYIKSVKDWWTDSPLFAGSFSDLDPGWYSVVGVTILFTMIINMIVPHLTAFIGMLIKYISRFCDGGCSCGKKTNKKYKKDYLDLYIGPHFPIEVRYAEMLTTFFVALVYSSGIPILYFCILGYLTLTYIVDKLLLLRFYRMPPKYDLYMAKAFNIFIIFALIIHYAVAIWIYGNPKLLVDYSSTSLDSIKNIINGILQSDNEIVISIANRITMPHNIICLIFWALIIVFLFLRYTLYSIFEKIFGKGMNLEKKRNLEIGLAIPYKSLYKNYELRKIQYIKLMKYNKLRGVDTTLLTERMKNYLQLGINYDREFLKYKLDKIAGEDLKNLNENFDEEIKVQMSKISLEEEPIIGGDVSFNIAYLPEYEAIAYYEYLKNIY